jgi:HEAT repeat protein
VAKDALTSEKPGMRRTGLVVLEKLKSPDAQALALALLADPDSTVRLQAALMLPDTADERTAATEPQVSTSAPLRTRVRPLNPLFSEDLQKRELSRLPIFP